MEHLVEGKQISFLLAHDVLGIGAERRGVPYLLQGGQLMF